MNTDLPWIAFSYEKAMRHRSEFINQLSTALRINPSRGARRRAMRLIKHSPSNYIAETVSAHVIGQIDRYSLGRIEGWLVNQNDHFSSVSADAFLDGVYVGTFQAENERTDLQTITPANTKHGFSFTFSPDIASDHHVFSIAITEGGRIENNNYFFYPTAIYGCFDGLVGRSLCAWFYNRFGRSEDLIITIMIDGEVLGRATACHHRADLENAGLTDVCGISFGLPPMYQDVKSMACLYISTGQIIMKL